jgi:hypothetical protein
VIPTVLGIGGHLSTDLLEGVAVGMEVFKKLAITVVTAFHLLKNMKGAVLTILMVDMDDIVYVMHVHDKPPHLLWNFALGFFDIVDDF